MVLILKENSIKSFYEDSVKNRKSNKENLVGRVSPDFMRILKKLLIRKNYKALDLGYGFGNYSIELAKKGFEVVAIDYISTKYFRNRIKKLKISKKVRIIKGDLNSFIPKEKYHFVVAKDTLHFLSKQKVGSLLKNLIKSTEINGWHYMVIFTDIKREFIDGERIKIENEANLTKDRLLDLVNKLYKNWRIKIKSENYKEIGHSGISKEFNFYAKKIIIIANKN